MHQGLRLSRLWLAVVLVAFCLPLFVGLGRADLETDEAIYSFAVDRILEIGDWLAPRSSPSETEVFLEKPPLKFWIVAAPIKAGLLPHNEFGLRFWDALLGGAAFLYVFAIGTLLAGPVCGGVAVLLLFVHNPLLFQHGLRSNSMEGPLVACYCGGVFHFLRWAVIDDDTRRRRQTMFAALWFVLGFMTKFVAALFLPFTLGLAALAAPRLRARLWHDRAAWLKAAGLVLLLCAPWFVYAQGRFGWLLWETILGEHVLRRMTSFIDPTHVHPWNWYFTQMWFEFSLDRTQWLMAAGLVTLLVQTIRRRSLVGSVVLLWAIVPMAIISAGSSKLYHYAYPFLPPFALAAGYLIALLMMLAPSLVRRCLAWVEDALAQRVPAVAGLLQGAVGRRVAGLLVLVAAALVAATVVEGPMRFHVAGVLVKTSGVTRPLALMLVAAVLARMSARVATLTVALFVFALMPVDAYRRQLDLLPNGKHPMRTTAECVQQVQATSGRQPGLFINAPELRHPHYYYFRRVQPVERATRVDDLPIERDVLAGNAPRPMLLDDRLWKQWRDDHGRPSPPMALFLDSVVLLPGPYAACSSEAVLRTTP